MKLFHPLPDFAVELVSRHEHSVLLETSRFDGSNYRSFLFLEPHAILRADTPKDIPEFIANLERCALSGLHSAGYLAYEAGHVFEPSAGAVAGVSPLAWFGIYKDAYVFDHRTGRWNIPPPEIVDLPVQSELRGGIRDLAFNLAEDQYELHVRSILEHIREGDTYQINFSMRCGFIVDGGPTRLYKRLKREQPVSFGALMRCGGDRSIISLSPELFFRIDGNSITAKPMKGTAPRGRTVCEDENISASLAGDEKNRAENLMIVDLLRNDIGRVAVPGSVHVPEMFSVERYPTVFQMTSTVVAEMKSDTGIGDVLTSLFPCGSITGAPKIRSMQIIAEEEQIPRGVYTGAIGYVGPQRQAQFNVAIRTIELNGERGMMGVGGGVVADSTPAAEYNECLLKASFLTSATPEFELIESILWERSYGLLDYHLDRLRESAGYFGFEFDESGLQSALDAAAKKLPAVAPHKVRLTVSRAGLIAVESAPLNATPRACTVSISDVRVDSSSKFLFHKTTNRELYEAGHAAAIRAGHADVLYFNERGELTEGAISNVLLEIGEKWYTPPIESGLLAGVYRRHLLETVPNLSEHVLYIEDLRRANKVYICNAVRGLREVKVVGL